ncbi:MAG: rRNA (cytidine1920-2-O)/16S rRNA (cytidine1409-2-O)-methyltransferase [Frankiaceae bacterium]|nr:rRNA (cytidine1920-2-O)/16S rRNA (cytidine1409-2-O)-methyltransferase [Frankiaceae bacterium]
MTAKPRLDAELVRRGLARSRQHARELVADGRVKVAGLVATKPASGVDMQVSLVVDDAAGGAEYASRGAAKLLGALDAFPEVAVAGRRALDAGASTGGFTDVLLRRGAEQVVAVDVGYGQLAWRLRTDPRVVVVERTNVRTLTADAIGGPVQLVVADLSFISLALVLAPLAAVALPAADLVLLVKPQFEAGRERVGRGGVVRDPEVRRETVLAVARAAGESGLGVHGVHRSPLPGPAGNVEYFLWLRRGVPGLGPEDIDAAVRRAVQESE